MAKTKRTEAAAPEGQQEGAVTREVIGPDSADELLGCQDGYEAELAEVECIEYAVAGRGGAGQHPPGGKRLAAGVHRAAGGLGDGPVPGGAGAAGG